MLNKVGVSTLNHRAVADVDDGNNNNNVVVLGVVKCLHADILCRLFPFKEEVNCVSRALISLRQPGYRRSPRIDLMKQPKYEDNR